MGGRTRAARSPPPRERVATASRTAPSRASWRRRRATSSWASWTRRSTPASAPWVSRWARRRPTSRWPASTSSAAGRDRGVERLLLLARLLTLVDDAADPGGRARARPRRTRARIRAWRSSPPATSSDGSLDACRERRALGHADGGAHRMGQLQRTGRGRRSIEPTALLDIALTALLFYGLFSLIQGTRAVRLVIGAIVLYGVYAIARAARPAAVVGHPRDGRRGRPAGARGHLPAGAPPGARAHRPGGLDGLGLRAHGCRRARGEGGPDRVADRGRLSPPSASGRSS